MTTTARTRDEPAFILVHKERSARNGNRPVSKTGVQEEKSNTREIPYTREEQLAAEASPKSNSRV